VYFEQIRKGEKTFELRSDTDYYRNRLEDRDYDQVMLHYQRPERVYAKVVSIKKILTPHGIDPAVISTPYCWKIEVRNPRFRYVKK
jgi:hypothetical protein